MSVSLVKKPCFDFSESPFAEQKVTEIEKITFGREFLEKLTKQLEETGKTIKFVNGEIFETILSDSLLMNTEGENKPFIICLNEKPYSFFKEHKLHRADSIIGVFHELGHVKDALDILKKCENDFVKVYDILSEEDKDYDKINLFLSIVLLF